MRGIILGVALAAMTATAAPAQQAETLADIRQDMAVLFVELQRLKQELNTTGSSGIAVSGGPLDRLNGIEAELQRMTSRIEQLEFRIGQVVEDGTNRLGDLDFRLCEIDDACDIATLGDTPRLGGAAVPPASSPAPRPAPMPGAGTDSLPAEGELAVSEEADFVAARDALDKSEFAVAAQLFAAFRQTYPQGPLEAAALVGEGRALEGQGDTREAARRYLSAYTDYPEARVAPEALWRLGTSLAALGSVPEACVTLVEVGNRYAGSDFAGRAAESRAQLGCQ
jgi:tol-pal system protein YbgF